MRVLIVVSPTKSGISYYRQIMPFNNLKNYFGIDVEQAICGGDDLINISSDQLKTYDAIYFSRAISLDGKNKQIIDMVKDLGLKVWYDMDDYWYLPITHPMYNQWESYKMPKKTVECIKYSDAVFTTTFKMFQSISTYNPNTYITPNAIDATEPQWQIRNIKSERIRVGWIGGVFHLEDIKLLKDCFKKISEDSFMKDNVQLCLGGYTPGQKEYKGIEKIFTNDYKLVDMDYKEYLDEETNLMEHISFDKPYRRLYGRDVEQYGDMYNELDIVLIPLVSNYFNKHKSQLKVIEAGMMGKTVLVSNIYPYTIDCNSSNSYLINSEKEWFPTLKKIIESRVGNYCKLNKEVKEKYDINVINKERERIFKTIVK